MYSHITANKRKTAILVILFFSILLFIGWVFGEYTGSGYAGIILAGAAALVMTLIGYYSGDTIALRAANAHGPITKQDNPYVWRMVENLSIAAGMPMPRIYIIPDPALNAFATGRDPNHASIALTTGIIEVLENEELEGVIAHELAHIKNYDIRLMTLVGVLVGSIILLSDMFWRWSFFGGSSNREQRSGSIIAIIGILLIILSPIIAQLIKLAISRKREYLADASGALLTRYPQGLANALRKISTSRPMERTSAATAHLFIENPFRDGRRRTRSFFAALFSTHPPIEKRIEALEEMAYDTNKE